MIRNLMISVLCLTYNHEKYIRQCLDGFVMQKDVSFEIIIHDDASTDKTADIIHEYEKKYPTLFMPIYQSENQYTKQTDILKLFMVPFIRGKYVAICEGDDYWTDPYKLKKQYDALENNPDCCMCLHNVRVVNEEGVPTGKYHPECQIPSGKMTTNEYFQSLKIAKYYQTSSYFFLSEKYIEFRKKPPRFKSVAPVGDEPTLLYFAYIGSVYYIDEIMSNYRHCSKGSWSSRITEQTDTSWKMREKYYTSFMEMLKEFSLYSGGKYDKDISFQFDSLKRMELLLEDDKYWYCLNNREYKQLFMLFSYKELKKRGLSNKAILKMKLQVYFPRLFA